jgi:hypothetical protein
MIKPLLMDCVAFTIENYITILISENFPSNSILLSWGVSINVQLNIIQIEMGDDNKYFHQCIK